MANNGAAFTMPAKNNMIAQRTMPTELGVFSRGKAKQQVVEEVDEDVTMFDGAAETVGDLSILALRLATCSLMIHHGFDKVQNVDGFSANVVAKYFGFLPGPPSFWALSAAATQIVGSGLLTVGVASRPVSFAMMCTMIVAVIFHLLNTGVEGFPLAVVPQHSYNFELAAMYVATLAFFTANGAGKFSVDNLVFGGEGNLYQGILEKVGITFEDEDDY